MPLAIVAMGIIFNLVNSYMIGGWLFYVSPQNMYPVSWLWSPLFILGTVIFFAGMAINWHSDHIIRNLRKPGDTRHYIPRGRVTRYSPGALADWLSPYGLSRIWHLVPANFMPVTKRNLAMNIVNLKENTYFHFYINVECQMCNV